MTKGKGNTCGWEGGNHFLSTWGESGMRTGHNNVPRAVQGQKIPQERQFLELKGYLKLLLLILNTLV